jgi:hypothetical protein
MIIVDNIEQGTPEWDERRIANIGASSAKSIITTKGEPSKSADKLLVEFANESILNRKTPKYSSYRMKEGLLYEDESFRHRNMVLAATHGVQMQKVALCYKDDKKLCHISPDGLVPEIEEGFETKDSNPNIQYERIKNHNAGKNGFLTEHFQQVQMSLYVTGYKRWILQSYCRNMSPLTLTVYPDYEFIKKLEARLNWFVGKLTLMVKEFKEAT